MKILYGVQATGNGHITRARVLADEFNKQGVHVDWIFSGRLDDSYFDMECFDHYKTLRGLTFVIKNGKVNYLKTAQQLNFRNLLKDIKSLDLSEYDLVISDFEPVTAWAARIQKKYSIGLSHQCSFAYKIPKKGSNPIASLIMKWFAPVTLPIGIHWHHFNSNILPPIIETEVSSNTRAHHILVYFPFISLEKLIELFKPFHTHHFYIYHNVKESHDIANIHIRPFSKAGFHNDLKQTGGVICGAGFELPSEAIQMGKKLLVQPIARQMEQQSNALALQQLNMAVVTEQFTHSIIAHWLNSHTNIQINFPNVAEHLVNWIKEGNWQSIDSLINKLWQK